MDKLGIKRGRFLAPSLFTVGNMACGFYAVLSVHREQFVAAATAILLGMVFDALDGRVARFVRGESAFGVEFDSLSDFLTFGVAPAHMMYGFLLKDYGPWGYPLAFFYAMCGALRLARFNTSTLTKGGSKTHFTGLPIPAGAGFFASFVLLYQLVEEGSPAHLWKFLVDQVPLLYGLAPAMMVVISLLMVSTIPYPAFKDKSLFRPQSKMILLILAGAVAMLLMYPQNTIFTVFFSYALLGPVGWIVGRVRRAKGGAENAPGADGPPSH